MTRVSPSSGAGMPGGVQPALGNRDELTFPIYGRPREPGGFLGSEFTEHRQCEPRRKTRCHVPGIRRMGESSTGLAPHREALSRPVGGSPWPARVGQSRHSSAPRQRSLLPAWWLRAEPGSYLAPPPIALACRVRSRFTPPPGPSSVKLPARHFYEIRPPLPPACRFGGRAPHDRAPDSARVCRHHGRATALRICREPAGR